MRDHAALLRDLEPHVKDGVNEWRQQQTLGLVVDALDADYGHVHPNGQVSVQAPSRRKLIHHLARQSGYAAEVVGVSLVIGMVGYHVVAHLPWIDAFQNSAMLLGGMGPVGEVRNDAGKIFAGIFALYAGLVFLAVTALVLTPVFHHALHWFHWQISKSES